MANYPQLDDCSGVWTLKEVHDAVMGGYWRNAGGGSRAIFMAGKQPTQNTIDFINMVTPGDASDFGDLTQSRANNSAIGSFTRAICAGGAAPGVSNHIDYFTFASTGNAADFGDLLAGNQNLSAGGNSTRGVVIGGIAPGNVNTLQYLTIAVQGIQLTLVI